MAKPKEPPTAGLPVHELLLVGNNDKSDGSSDSGADLKEPNTRHTWNKKAEYFLSIVGYCVGLGNVWRFPYVCMRNGGGAFLIPFLIALFLCAYPLFFMEMAVGQFVGKGPWHIWEICPLLRGIGLSMNVSSLVIGWYYTMILAWCLVYLVNSFKSPLPWTLCGQWWNSPDCVTPEGFRAQSGYNGSSSSSSNISISSINSTSSINSSSIAFSDGNYNNFTMLNGSAGLMNGVDVIAGAANRTAVSSSEEFWLHNVLELTPSMDELGGLPWHTPVALAVSNLVIFVALVKGILSSGKVVYVTATLPYFLLGVILVMGCTLPGASDGILFYIKPDFEKLMHVQTWIEASIQVFYSLGPGWGCLLNMASYNKFHYNCLKDSVILVLLCEGTSIFGGFAIFSVLGHMAYVAQVPVTDFARSGAGLAFIVYPEAISYLPIPQLWGFLFFLMLFTVGLDTQMANIEILLTTLQDVWPAFIRRWRAAATASVMTLFAVTGLVFTARGGGYVFQIVDWYIAAFTLLIQTVLELVAVAWFYGTDRFSYDIELMVGRRPPYVLIAAWKYLCPCLLFLLFLVTIAFYEPPTFAGYVYPPYAIVIGWVIAVLPFCAILGYAVFMVMRTQGSLLQRLRKCVQTPANWGPSNVEAREQYNYVPTCV